MKRAEVLDEWFGRTIIHSNRRFNYEEAQQIIETGEGDMKEEILKLYEISKILKENRFSNGSINFERDEVKFHLAEDGTPTGVYFKVQKEANWLIEEFMLLANKKVAAYASRGGKYAKGGESAGIEREKNRWEKPLCIASMMFPIRKKSESFSRFITKFGHTLNPQQSARRFFSDLNRLLDDVQGNERAECGGNDGPPIHGQGTVLYQQYRALWTGI